MCMSKPKVKPVVTEPVIAPVSMDEVTMFDRDRERRRQLLRSGRQSTILAGSQGGGNMPTASVKTALGA